MEGEIVCDEYDWECLQKKYKGYAVFLEALYVDDEMNTRISSVELTGLKNDEINEIIDNFKVLHSDANEIRVHFCGNHLARPCKIIKV